MDSELHNTDDLLNDYVYWLAGSDKFSQKGTGVCFAARTSGLYRSEDGGQTWHPAYTSLGINEPLPTMAVAIPGVFETEQSVFAGVSGGILRSRDGGISWESLQLPAPPPAIVAMIASPNFTQDGVLFAGTMEDGVLCSSDRGRHWVAWNFGLLDLNVLCLGISPSFASDETLFAGTQTGLFRSTNGGRAWREVDLPIGFEAVLSLELSPQFMQDGIMFIGTENHGLLQSPDWGDNWERLGETDITDPVDGIYLHPDFPHQPEMTVLAGGMIYRSHDHGRTWHEHLPSETGDLPVTAIFAPQGFNQGKPVLLGLAGGKVIRLGLS